MAWRSSGSSNQQLVDKLYNNGLFQEGRLYKALLEVDRGNFVRESQKINAYQDAPMVIYNEETVVTISAPHMHAMQLDLLADKLVPGAKCLDIGSGSGYIVAAMAALVFPPTEKNLTDQQETKPINMSGKVIGIEYIKNLVPWSIDNCKKVPRFTEMNLFGSKKIEIVQGNAWDFDFSVFPDLYTEVSTESEPGKPKRKFLGFDAIHVGAAADEFPHNLMKSLKIGGKMVIPVGGTAESSFFGFSYPAQTLYLVTRTKLNEWDKKEICDVQFVPLVHGDKDE